MLQRGAEEEEEGGKRGGEQCGVLQQLPAGAGGRLQVRRCWRPCVFFLLLLRCCWSLMVVAVVESRFDPSRVRQVLLDVLSQRVSDMKYDPDSCPELSKELCNEIQAEVKSALHQRAFSPLRMAGWANMGGCGLIGRLGTQSWALIGTSSLCR